LSAKFLSSNAFLQQAERAADNLSVGPGFE
jgi:hypothetical protein